jgi:hypothetical protein
MAEALDVVDGKAVLTERDFVEAWGHVPQFRRAKRAFLWLLPALGALMILSAANRGGLRWAVMALVPAGITLALGIGALPLLRARWAKRVMRDAAPGETTFRFDEAGVQATNSLRRHELKWVGLMQQVETSSSFLICASPRLLLVVPKRAFRADDLQRLRQMLQQRIAAKRQPSRLPRLLLLWCAVFIAILVVWQFLSTT